MPRRSLIVGTIACLAVGWSSPAGAAAPRISATSKQTLYCDPWVSNLPMVRTCLFPVTETETTWPSWVDDADKAGILEAEETLSLISDIVGGVSMVQGWVKTGMSIATALGLIETQPNQLAEIEKKLAAISAQIGRLEQLQLKVHESLFLQNNSTRLHDAATLMRMSHSAFLGFPSAHPGYPYPACLSSGALDCAPFWRSDAKDPYAFAAHADINEALGKLDITHVGGLDPVWLDTGLPGAFDPRVAATFYLAMVAQELTILTWEVGTYGLTPDFRDRLAYRAAFINQVLIPNLKEWVHARCDSGPHVQDGSGSPSPLGTKSRWLGDYHSVSAGPGMTEAYGSKEWSKSCDYSSDTRTVFGCIGTAPAIFDYKQCVAFKDLRPLDVNPFSRGDATEMITLERIGLSQWSYQAANLIGVANDATYAGCFSRAGSGKLLPNRQAVAAVTVAKCIQAAKTSSHSFAQLTPDGCFTGNGIGALVRIPDANCDKPCVESVGGAESGEMCGGDADASSVYQVVSSMSVLVASNLVGGKTSYVGCYQPPALTAQVLQVDSAEACLNAAVSAKTVYASVEPGGVCRLSNTLLGSAPLPEASCNSPCPAAAAQTCGGAGAASVFATNDPMVSQAPPQSLVAWASGPNSVRLTWTDTSDSETGFRVERRLTASPASTYVPVVNVMANVGAYEDSGLSPGTSYTYRIQTALGATYSISSNEASATTWPAGAKAPPWLTPILELLLE